MSQNVSLSINKSNHRVTEVTENIPSTEIFCDHCGLPVTPSNRIDAEINGEKKVFCCTGCREVCKVIYSSGFENYYEKVKQNEECLTPPAEKPKYTEQYDLEDIQQEFITHITSELKEAEFIVEGMHCASCVWLIEKALSKAPGVERVEVNLSLQRLKLRWNQQKESLSSLIKYLSSFGYSATPYNPETAEGKLKKFNRKLLYKMAFAGFAAMNMMWISVSLYAGSFTGIEAKMKHFFHITEFFIASASLFYSGSQITSSGLKGLFKRHLTMDLPIAIGAWITWGYSAYQTFIGKGEVYFETVASFLFIILVGRYLEAVARKNASSASFRLSELQPKTAARITESGEERVAVKKLKAGDKILIRPGDAVPVDGIIIEGDSSVDESMMTGESTPVDKKEDDLVKAGTMNLNGTLLVKTTEIGSQTMLSKIVKMVEAAQGSKASIQQFADKIVPWFVGATILLSFLTFTFWYFLSPGTHGFDFSLLAAISVLVITCPCALGLATPMSIVVSSGLAASLGFLIRDGRALERLSQINHVVFDKTGTLTRASLSVKDVYSHKVVDEKKMIKMASSVENCFQHPISRAISRLNENDFFPVKDARSFPGLGVSGAIEDHKILLGSPRFLKKNGISIPPDLKIPGSTRENDLHTFVFMAIGNVFAGYFHLEDLIRDEVPELLEFLRKNNISATILTGDNEAAAKQVSLQTRIEDVRANLLPEEKLREVISLQAMGKKVLMIGDGVNDAPALARADTGIAMGSGTDISMQSSDVVLLEDDLSKVIQAMILGKTALKTIRQNIVLSLIYNAILVPVAMAGLVTPVFASIAMPLSSLTVIGNSIRIRKKVNQLFKRSLSWM